MNRPMRVAEAAGIFAAVGLGHGDRAALRAFALAITPATFEAAFAARLVERTREQIDAGSAEAEFFRVLLDRMRWCEPDWLDALGDAWQACERIRSPSLLAAKATSALLEAARDALDDGRTPGGRAEWDLLGAVEKLVQVVATRLWQVSTNALILRHDDPCAFDPVTGLPARERFISLVGQSLEPGKAPTGLLLLHFDWGLGGQRLLAAQRDRLRRTLSEAMSRILRPCDMLCALGDHEWALVMPGLQSGGQVMLAAQRLVDICASTTESGFPELRARIHVGHAQAPDDAASREALEQAARAALHSALREGVPVAGFRAEMVPGIAYELALERDVARAIARPPFELWLQPQISLATGRCDCAEALLRWRRDADDWVPPSRLVEVVSRLGMMPALSRWVLSQSVRMISEIEATGVDMRVALNLVAGDLHDEDLPELVAQTLAAWRVPARKLCLEVTESALIGDLGRAAAIIERLRSQGCGVALDDFGTGFSSLGYLRDLPVTELKIDQLFVREMLKSDRDRAIVTSIQALARGFRMSVVAEGVENAATADELRRIGCDYAQGFLYAPAMPQRKFADWLLARERRPD